MKDFLFAIGVNDCGKRFKTNSYLNQNKRRVDLKQRKFVCDYNNCENKFFSKYVLEKHKRIDSGEKPFIYDDNNCGKRFAQKSHLNSHKKIHLK